MFETLMTNIEEFKNFKDDDVIGCYLRLGNRWSEVSLDDSTFVTFAPEIKHVKYILRSTTSKSIFLLNKFFIKYIFTQKLNCKFYKDDDDNKDEDDDNKDNGGSMDLGTQ